MGFKTKSKILGLTATASIAMIIAGCGGSGGGTVVVPGNVNVSGGLTAGTSTSAATVDATGGEQKIFNAFGTLVGVLPQGQVVPAGGSFAIIPKGVPILNSLTLKGRASGDVWVNGILSSVKITNRTTGSLLQGAQLDGNLLLAAGTTNYLQLDGPFVVASGGQTLDINGSIYLTVETNNGGVTSLPSGISGTLPANGSSSSNGQVMTSTAGAAFGGRQFSLTIFHGNGTLSKTVTANGSGTASFNDIVSGSNSSIPTGGVTSVSLDILP